MPLLYLLFPITIIGVLLFVVLISFKKSRKGQRKEEEFEAAFKLRERSQAAAAPGDVQRWRFGSLGLGIGPGRLWAAPELLRRAEERSVAEEVGRQGGSLLEGSIRFHLTYIPNI